MPGPVRAVLVLTLLYLFLVGVKLLESGIKGLGSDIHETLFEGVTNPLAALFVGILGTVLVQSSSVTTATIVGLVASGVISVESAVPMVVGANIGTTVTNDAVGRALLYRYLKRIVAHLMNMLSMLVVPIDRLDYYDEDKDTRD